MNEFDTLRPKPEQAEPPSPWKKHRRLVTWLAAGLGGAVCLSVLATGSWYFYRVLPEETYDALYQNDWSPANVSLMAFKTPDDFRKAEKTLLSALGSRQDGNSQKDVIPHFLLGELYDTLNRPTDAITHYRSVITLSDQSWYNRTVYHHFADEAHGALAILYYNNNKKEASLAELQRIRDLDGTENVDLLEAMKDSLENPDRADFHMALGKELRQQFQIARAKEEIMQAQTLSKSPELRMTAANFLKTKMPQHITDLAPMARYYSMAAEMHQGEEDDLWQAANYYEKAIRETPRFEWGYNELAVIYRQLKDYEKAGSNAQQAIALNPNCYNAYLTLGDVSLDGNDFRKAIESYKTAQGIIGRLPDEDNQNLLANIENQLGFAYESLNDKAEAAQHYRQALALAGNSDEDAAQDDYAYAQDALERLASKEDADHKQQTAQTEGRHLSSL